MRGFVESTFSNALPSNRLAISKYLNLLAGNFPGYFYAVRVHGAVSLPAR